MNKINPATIEVAVEVEEAVAQVVVATNTKIRTAIRAKIDTGQSNSKYQGRQRQQSQRRAPFCYVCYTEGHSMRDCPELQEFREFRRTVKITKTVKTTNPKDRPTSQA